MRAEGREVVLRWTAAPDDTAAVGVAAGLLPDDAVDAYLGAAPASAVPTDDEIRALSSDPALTGYLIEHVSVSQGGRDCAGVVEPAPNFIAEGATFRFGCPEPVVRADVRITLLHDLDPAYRTFLIDGSVQTAVLTSTSPAATWDFASGTPADPAGGLSTMAAAAIGAGGLAVGVLVLAGVRRRRLVARP